MMLELRAADKRGAKLLIERQANAVEFGIAWSEGDHGESTMLVRAIGLPHAIPDCLAPRIQDLNDGELSANVRHDLDAQAPALLVGMANHLHWSLSVTRIADRHSSESGFDFDVACRRGRDPFQDAIAVAFEVAPEAIVGERGTNNDACREAVCVSYRCPEPPVGYVATRAVHEGNELYFFAETAKLAAETKTLQWRFQLLLGANG